MIGIMDDLMLIAAAHYGMKGRHVVKSGAIVYMHNGVAFATPPWMREAPVRKKGAYDRRFRAGREAVKLTERFEADLAAAEKAGAKIDEDFLLRWEHRRIRGGESLSDLISNLDPHRDPVLLKDPVAYLRAGYEAPMSPMAKAMKSRAWAAKKDLEDAVTDRLRKAGAA